jgi:hypothetical protein
MLDELSLSWVACHDDDLCQTRRDDRRPIRIDARRRNQDHSFRGRSDVKLAGFGETFANILNPVAVVWIDLEYTPLTEMDHAVRFIDRRDGQVRLGPAGGYSRFAVGRPRPGPHVASGILEFLRAGLPVGTLFAAAPGHDKCSVLGKTAADEAATIEPQFADHRGPAGR